MTTVIDAFLDHLRVERRLADHTVESYARDLAALASSAAAAGRPPDGLDRAALEAFVREQMTRGLSPRSVARAVAAIRGFYRFLVLDRRLEHSPADDLQPPRAWPSLPTFLTLDGVDALIERPDVSTPRGLRDRAMIEVLYATGMRVSELLMVRSSDLHLDERYLTCIGKGNKERIVPIGDQASDWVLRYQRDGRQALIKGRASPQLFLNSRGGPLSRVGFWKLLKEYGRRAKLPATLSPHVFAPFVRHAPARAWRGFAGDTDDARARRPVDHPDLHPRARDTPPERLRSLPSAPVILIDLVVSGPLVFLRSRRPSSGPVVL